MSYKMSISKIKSFISHSFRIITMIIKTTCKVLINKCCNFLSKLLKQMYCFPGSELKFYPYFLFVIILSFGLMFLKYAQPSGPAFLLISFSRSFHY